MLNFFNSKLLIIIYNILLIFSTNNVFVYVSAVARTIKIPLMRGVSLTAGQYQQPVVNYYTPISIGTPGKDFLIQFDINLSDPFVPHYTWNPFKSYLHYSNGFQCKSSSTCNRDSRDLTIEYQNCQLSGKPYEDIILYKTAFYNDNNSNNMTTLNSQNNNNNNLTFSGLSMRQKFLGIYDASDGRFKDLPIDGFISLSPLSQSLKGGILNPLVSFYQAKLIDNLQFSFWFNPILDSNQGGELTLGGVDVNRYQGQIYWHHLNDKMLSNEWSINLQFVSISNQIVSCQSQNCLIVLSSALNEIYGPINDVEKIYKLLNSTTTTITSKTSLQFVDCNLVSQLPFLTFSVDGIPYALLSTNYVRKTSNGKCYLAILPNLNDSTQKKWILGTNFLGAYYSTFDLTQKQVGFASMR